MMISRLLFCIFLMGLCKAEAQSSAFAVADSLYKTGNYLRAINAYAKQNSSKAQLQIARSYNALGNYEKAIRQYLSVVKKDSSLLVAKNELGKLYYKKSFFDDARTVYSELIEKDDKNPFYYYQLGMIEDKTKNEKTAIAHFKRSYTLDSTNIKNLYEIGKHHLRHREFDSVHKYADVGLRIAPNSVEINNLKALTYYNFDEKEEAIPYFEKLLELGQHEIYIYKNLAECYKFVWEYDKAFACYKTILVFDNANPEAYRGLGYLYLREKQYDSAKVSFQTAIEVQKVSFKKEYLALARIALDEKDVKTAIDYYKKVYAEDKRDYRALYQVCFYSDKYYKDPALKLRLYEDFLERFPKKNYYSKYATNRVSELKTEIHMSLGD
ncbi:tetratricopeptide repeat protein [Galbibacter sp. EGI 63066]|uniref:tetratricopeptide repeat protein n=1 Tax=Galbibacter sp. EGI 63066 TaxID=2993559 RepID=UPI002248C302|nr:tetratricopeptide repeat protein [Galbibacter sp. EGI 63066]MCX2678782.1 tetratricopeptide repeat protein [Galbibacter sp. EGI 63066]